jgi:hypothetical protein
MKETLEIIQIQEAEQHIVNQQCIFEEMKSEN